MDVLGGGSDSWSIVFFQLVIVLPIVWNLSFKAQKYEDWALYWIPKLLRLFFCSLVKDAVGWIAPLLDVATRMGTT